MIREVYDKCTIFRRQASGMVYLIDPFGHSIPTMCIFLIFLSRHIGLQNRYKGPSDRFRRGAASVYKILFLSHYVKTLAIMSHAPDSLFSSERPLPTFDELPAYKNFSGCAWAVWGPDDQLGTVNLLTEDVVKKAAEEEIKYVSFEFEIFLES